MIRSSPTGADVTVDGKPAGHTPLTLSGISLTTHALQVTRAGFVSRTERVTLSSKSPSRTISLTLKPAPKSLAARGSIFVDSRPRGARVRIDGRDVGATPISVPELSAGAHHVQIELAGHKPVSSTATVTPGQQTRVTVTMEKVGGYPAAPGRK